MVYKNKKFSNKTYERDKRNTNSKYLSSQFKILFADLIYIYICIVLRLHKDLILKKQLRISKEVLVQFLGNF